MQDFVDYKQKYLKYKLKYLELETALEGAGISPVAAFRVGQAVTRTGKQLFKYGTGKYDEEINEINHILNKTVYLQDGRIIESFGYNPYDLQGAQILYTNTDLLLVGSEDTLDNSTSESDSDSDLTPVQDIDFQTVQVNKSQDLNKLPNVKKFLRAVKQRIKVYKNKALDQNVPVLIKSAYQNGVKSLERILEIHYMCKGATGVFTYTIKECFKNIYAEQQKNQIAMQPPQQNYIPQQTQQPYFQQPQQNYPAQPYYTQRGGELSQEEYKQKYYKYKAKYYQLIEHIEQNGGMKFLAAAKSFIKAAPGNIASGIASAAKSVTSGAKALYSQASKATGQAATNINTVRQILQENPEFAIKLGDDEKATKEKLAKLKKKITDLEGKLYSCKKTSGSKTYDEPDCFQAPASVMAPTAASTSSAAAPTDAATATSTPALTA